MDARNETNRPTFLEKQNLFDGITAVVAAGGAIAAAATQNVALAAFPLAGAIGVHIFNRRQLLAAMTDHYETMIRQQNLYIVNHQESLNALSARLQTWQEEMNVRIERETGDIREQIRNKGQEIVALQDITGELTQFTATIDSKQQQLRGVVERIQQIENASHILQTDPDSARMYYQRGLNFHKLGEKQDALIDFNRAIDLDPQYADAYHGRGILLAEMGDRQGAVDDLRAAAKYYFELGEIDSYQRSKDLALELYDHSLTEGEIPVRSREGEEVKVNSDPTFPDQVLVGGLFEE
ncbi:tetratricopeptide repeat protein [Pannus brasiliensis CCIBt3594]|uniref:Tetratricopeptide repeat protein n=1 Tax=Pannus brasiliensis CCIBt3594 TaxID=1427578 RepID=A0AAW9QSZ8_9CHRO